MKPKHTPEPWRVGNPGHVLKDAPNLPIQVAFTAANGGTDEETANADRIIACVNALAGVANPSAIEKLIDWSLQLSKHCKDYNVPELASELDGIEEALKELGVKNDR